MARGRRARSEDPYTLDSVSVTAANGQSVLKNVSLKVEPGELRVLISEQVQEWQSVLALAGGFVRTARKKSVKMSGRLSTALEREGLVTSMSVRKNMHLLLSKSERIEKVKMDRLRVVLGLEKVWDDSVASLSLRLAQRIILMRCLCRIADGYLISGGLDELEDEELSAVRELMAWHCQRGAKLIVGVRDYRSVARLGGMVTVLRNRGVVYDGPVARLEVDYISKILVANPLRLRELLGESFLTYASKYDDPESLILEALNALDLYAGVESIGAWIVSRQQVSELLFSRYSTLDEQTAREQCAAHLRGEDDPAWRHKMYLFEDDEIHFLYVASRDSFLPAELVLEEFCRAAEHQFSVQQMRQQIDHMSRLDAIGRLTSGIAHDVNNSIGSIALSTDLLLTMTENEELRGVVGHIRQASERIENLTRRLMQFTRKGQLSMEPLCLVSVLSGVDSMLQQTIGRNVEVKMEFAERPVYVRGDTAQLENAVINLAINARDAIEKAGEVMFSLWVEDGEAVLRVADTGKGMSTVVRQHAFEPFYTTKGDHGTGLGLFSVRKVMQDHDGSIEIIRSDVTGTVFEIRLPVIEGVVSRPERVSGPGVERSLERSHDLGRLVLVIDDEPVLTTLLGSILRSLGYEALCTTDPEEGVELFEQHQDEIMLVISDVDMPKLNGVDLVTRLLALNREANVVLISGQPLSAKVLSRMREEGLMDFLPKPFDTNELKDLLVRVENQPRS